MATDQTKKMTKKSNEIKEDNQQLINTLEIGKESVQLINDEVLILKEVIEEWTKVITQVCDQANEQLSYSLELAKSEEPIDKLWFWHTINLLYASLQFLEITTTDFLDSIHEWEIGGFRDLKNTCPAIDKWLEQHQEEIENFKLLYE